MHKHIIRFAGVAILLLGLIAPAVWAQNTSVGTISTRAGTGSCGYSGDGGLASSAQLGQPYDIAVDSSGDIFIAD